MTWELLDWPGGNGVFGVMEARRVVDPVYIMFGEMDTTIIQEERAFIASAIPRRKLVVLQAAPHPLEMVDMKRVAVMLRSFFQTMMRPI
jgi:hypothetical protein